MKWTFDELWEMGLRALGFDEGIVCWPVAKGNDVVVMYVREKAIRHAKIGDRLAVKGGGFVQKVEVEGWVQWRWWADNDPTAPALTGTVLQSPPTEILSPSASDRPEKPA